MATNKRKESPKAVHPGVQASQGKEIAGKMLSLSGREALNEILDQENPRAVVRGMVRSDFYWLVKRIGEDDALPLLSLASAEQWQHALDMELWQRDRLDLDAATRWLGRLREADSKRLAKWLTGEGEALAYYYLFRSIEVEVRKGDEALDLPEGFFTLDNLYYIRILNKDSEEVVRGLLQEIAHEDYERYQAILLGLEGVLPAETGEDLYRMRGVRLAEEGFLPFDEAVSAYSHLDANALIRARVSNESAVTTEEVEKGLVPVTHLAYAGETSLLAECARGIGDEFLLDRIRLEFAGLCNQLLSADGARVDDVEVLIKACRKAAGYLNIGLEEVSGGDPGVSEQVIRKNPLLDVFRVGFGQALRLRWEAEKWVKKAWFSGQGLNTRFWGEEWGGTLQGILEKKPRLFKGLREGEAFGEFERIAEIRTCQTLLRGLAALDGLLAALARSHPPEERWLRDPFFTFHALLFNFWARLKLGLEPGFGPLSLVQVRDMFRLLRAGTPAEPPYEMPGFEEGFVDELTAHAVGLDPDEAGRLREVLSKVWRKFKEEYAWVAVADLDGRYTRFVMTLSSHDVPPDKAGR